MTNIFPTNVEIKGLGVSEGIVIGRAFILSNKKVIVFRKKIDKSQVEEEVAFFLKAIETTKNELNKIKGDLLKNKKLKEYASIISAHIAMLEDKSIVSETINKILKDLVNAEWAFNVVMDKLIEHFENINDSYIRERKYDLEHLKDKVLKNLKSLAFDEPSKIKSKVVLIALDLSPADIAKLDQSKIKAIVTEMGSATSHTAIVAKALGIPAVVAAECILQKVTGGDLVIVDGKEGKVIINPDEQLVEFYKSKKEKEENIKKELFSKYIHIPSKTVDNVRVKLKVNIELPEEINTAKVYGCDGIGLYRTEFLFLNRNVPPSEEEHFTIYSQVSKEMYPKEVVIRTFDLGGDKLGYHHYKIVEKNPALGLRAIRYCFLQKEMFIDQICGILRANELGNIKLLFPFVSTINEIKMLKKILAYAKERLIKRKVPFRDDIKIGVMIEIPSSALIADELAKEVDFFNIGTNDLIQYTMAIDRSNEYVVHLYDPVNTSILRLLNFIIHSARKNKIPVSICGEMAGEAKYFPLLLAMGFREFSINPNSIPEIRKVISNINLSRIRQIYKQCKKGNYLNVDGFMKKVKMKFPKIFEY
jgi:phosphotransferase system enzyme I (PtsI)